MNTSKLSLNLFVIAFLVAFLPPSTFSQDKTPAGEDKAPTSPQPWVDTSYTAEQLSKLVPAARPEDVSSPEAIVRAMGESSSGHKGDWNSDRFRSLFLPNVLFSYVFTQSDGTKVVSSLSLDKMVQALTELLQKTDWYVKVDSVHVTMIDRPTQGVKLANADGIGGEGAKQSDLETIPHTRSATSLIFFNNRWWIASQIW
ncbi:hypothetical protein HNQ77_005357 [Silvibacterium bohemicum]|uniref:Uncharacterized protein n=1 Tax=Silvibacterium bohemicum TaxID=1577686 RepID=A0A841K8B7_9BACT|nr:hypothetical protein [Silvibacterium bohemicum]MBB6147361.1 hypothetical protein [Silvibacterium bohemicum]